jgi:hypothetical protein
MISRPPYAWTLNHAGHAGCAYGSEGSKYERGLQSAGSAAWRPDLDVALRPGQASRIRPATVLPTKAGDRWADVSHGVQLDVGGLDLA